MNDDAEILFEVRGRAGLVTLNRPQALNALTHDMALALHAKLRTWADMPAVERVIIRASGEKAFCAGGDIRQLYEWGRAGDPRVLQFYRDEYPLNAYIKHYRKPYIALIDGIVMGGGVGISVHGSHRIGTEFTSFAMPETGIGLFPDVGGTYFLPRMPGKTGTYIALTGARLKQGDALASGILTHAVRRADRDRLIDALCDDEIDTALSSFSAAVPPGSVMADEAIINRAFAADTVEAIVAALDGEGAWGAATAAAIATKSPTSLKIALRQMLFGATADFDACMRMEYRIVSRVVEGAEFYEGVRALIIDKDMAPHWQPSTLADVDDNMVQAFFAPLGANELEIG